MKSIKLIAGFILIASFAINSFSQAPNKTVKSPTKLEKKQIPKEVSEPYYREYPMTNFENWFGYPVYEYGDYWYDNWYENTPYVYTEYPEYYIIESSKDNIPYKAIYSKAGKKVAIHKSLKSDLPKGVSAAISKGEYKTWTLGKDKEEIFKDSDKDQMKVYKVDVDKGKEKHTLFFQSDGKLLKDKKVS
jgi:hypothetical protein